MSLVRRVELVAASRADDLAFEALADVARIAAEVPDVRVVGGLMVQLLMAAFPVPDAIPRRTLDADAAITPEIAASGVVHDRLLALGYVPEAGNRYVRGGRVLDLLVPSGHRFGSELLGGRAFDAVPGLFLAVQSTGLPLAVGLLFTDGRTATCTVTVPGVEAATVLKALVTTDRARDSDLVDLTHLLQIAAGHERSEFGGWRLDEAGLSGSRGDAVAVLQALTTRATAGSLPAVQRQQLVALIRTVVAHG